MSHLVRGLLALILLLQLSPAFGVGGAGVGNGRVPDPLSRERMDPTPPRLPGEGAPQYGLPSNSVLSLELSSTALAPGETIRVRILIAAPRPELIEGCSGELRSPRMEFSTLLFDECRVAVTGKHLVELSLSYRFPAQSLPRSYYPSRVSLRTPGGAEQELILPYAEFEIRGAKMAPIPLRALETWTETRSGRPEARLGESIFLRTLVETPGPLTAAGVEFQLDQGLGPDQGSLQFKGRDVSHDSQSSWIAGYRETPYGKLRLVEFELRIPEEYVAATRLDLRGILLLDEALQEVRVPVTENGSISVTE